MLKRFFLTCALLTFLLLSTSAQDAVDCRTELEIWQIQGSGEKANCENRRVQLNGNLVTVLSTDGFFIQTPAERSDNNPLTSDGIYVYTDVPPQTDGVEVGAIVNVFGAIQEYFNLTELLLTNEDDVTVLSTGHALPEAVDLATVSRDWVAGVEVHPFEPYEGMLVTVNQVAVAAPTNQFDEFGISLTGERVFREPGIEVDVYPRFAGLGLPETDLNVELIEVDPAETGMDVVYATVGSVVDVTGALAYSFEDYQIWATELSIDLAEFAARSVRTADTGEFMIATQNVENLFDIADDPQRNDALVEDYVPDTHEEYEIRIRKLSDYIRNTLGTPDILALQEVENARVLADVAYQIFSDDPTIRYATCFQEGSDERGIDNAFLVKTQSVNLNACYQMPGTLDVPAPIGNRNLFERPPLVLEADLLQENGDVLPITLINLHIKSLIDVETNATQAQRMEQAIMVANFVQALLDVDPDAHIVVLGDMNAFQFTDGLVDVVGIMTGTHNPAESRMSPEADTLEPNLINQVMRVPQDDRYSYIFNSTLQVLDHILTSPALDALVTDAQFSRGNADGFPYWHLEDNGGLRVSDHDGFVIYINPTQE